MTREALYDLVVVGGGPAGLSAAINAESESVNTLVLDAADQLGGQAGTSSLIENYPGFPGGVSGQRLTSLMIDQALRFSTEFLAPWRAERIEPVEDGLLVHDDMESVLGRTVLICAGVDYRRLIVPNLAAYLGRGVTYGSPRVMDNYDGKRIYVVGGANSAGQATMHLSRFKNSEVTLVLRGKSIEEKMSSYLCDRVTGCPNVQVLAETEITEVDGDGRLKEITLKSPDGLEKVAADELFILIGAAPKTHWLPGEIARDEYGFIKAGGDIDETSRAEFLEVNGRTPLPHETSMPGLFVAGDVRCGTIKRVASAVGDGATVVPDIHRYLASLSAHSR